MLAKKYASWDTTPTEADLAGFWSSDPELFLVAELDGKVVGFLVGREPRDILDEVCAVGQVFSMRPLCHSLFPSTASKYACCVK